MNNRNGHTVKIKLFAYFAQSFACSAIKKLFVLLLILLNLNAFGQIVDFTNTITDIAEDLAAAESDPEAVSLFIELLNELAEKPVKINTGEEQEISRIFFLSGFQVRSILDHISKTGSIVSAYEIASIPGFDRRTVEMMIPFIDITPSDEQKASKAGFRSSVITNLAIKPGDKDTSMPGSQLKILTKYKGYIGPFSAGITAEKDPGEKLFPGTPPLPDFLSCFLLWKGKGFVKKIVAGDYSARFGQATNINTRMNTGLQLTAPGYMTGINEIRPYTSSDENNFFRGIAAEMSFKNITASVLVSMNKLDASISASEDSAGLFVTALYKTGLHNSETSILKKDRLSEFFFGTDLRYDLPSFSIGFTWSECSFSLPFIKTTGDPENLYAFTGSRTGVLSANYSSMIKGILFSGEISSDYSMNYALVQGISLRPHSRLNINLLYRDYSPPFISFHGRGPGNSSATSNERGLTGNFTYEAGKYIFISAGCDAVWYPWLKYRTDYPSFSRRQEVKIRYVPGDRFSFEASYNNRNIMLNSDTDSGLPGIDEMTTSAVRGMIRFSASENFTLSARIDCKTSGSGSTRGMMLLQDIKYGFRLIPVTLWVRHCIFNTDDWETRIYSYENDLLNSFSIPALAGRGSRSYIMAEWKINDNAGIRIKYGLTTSLNESNTAEEKDELKFQFRLWF